MRSLNRLAHLVGRGAGLLLLLAAVPSQAAVTTSACANINVSCTLQELFDGGTIQIDDVEFSNFRPDFAFGDVAVYSTISVTADDTDPLNVGLKFSGPPITGNSFQSFFDFSYSVTIVSTAVSLTDASLEVISSTNAFSIDEDLSDAIDAVNPEFASLTVVDTTSGLIDAVVYSPTSFLFVENFLASDVGGSINDFNQYFSLTPVGTGAFMQDASGLLSMEAENYSASDAGTGPGPFIDVQRPNASNLEAIKAAIPGPANTTPVGAPQTSYEAEFVVTGPHYVWIRARGFGSAQNSVYVDLGDQAIRVRSTQQDGLWRWLRVSQPYNVAATGPVTLRIYRRERETEVDKIVVTPNANFNPETVNSGLGPDESPRVGGGTSNTGPALNPIADRTVVEGTTQTIAISSTDVNAGDTLTISVSGLPTLTFGSISLNPTGNGTADLVVSPQPGDATTSSFVTVTVTDDGLPNLSDSETFLLTIVPPGAGAFDQTGGVLSMEAEHFKDNQGADGAGQWLVLDPAAANASNAQAIKAATSAPSATPGSGSFTNYDARLDAGTQAVWARFRSFSSGTDSFFFQFNGGAIEKRAVGPDDGQWRWVKMSNAITVGASGVYTLTIYRRESAIEIDKLVVTGLAGYNPATVNGGVGPNESPRLGGSGNTAPELDPIGLQVVDEGATIVIDITASDGETDPLTLTTNPVSLFGSSPVNTGYGTWQWTVSPPTGSAGDTSVIATVEDSGVPQLSDDETFTFRVVDPTTTGPFIQDGTTGLLVAEAENYTNNVAAGGAGQWLLLDPASANTSNDKAVKAAAGGASATAGAGPYVEYFGEYSVTGPTLVWVRFRSFSTATDSFFFQFDGGPIRLQTLNPDDGEWHWVRLANPESIGAPGTYSFRIYRRERSTEIDKIITTPDAAYSPPPDGIGPPESPRL